MPLPSFWGGFRVSIEQMEFWQGGEHRLHDRFYTSGKMMAGKSTVWRHKDAKCCFKRWCYVLRRFILYLSRLAKSRVPAKVQSFIHGEFDGKQ